MSWLRYFCRLNWLFHVEPNGFFQTASNSYCPTFLPSGKPAFLIKLSNLWSKVKVWLWLPPLIRQHVCGFKSHRIFHMYGFHPSSENWKAQKLDHKSTFLNFSSCVWLVCRTALENFTFQSPSSKKNCKKLDSKKRRCGSSKSCWRVAKGFLILITNL